MSKLDEKEDYTHPVTRNIGLIMQIGVLILLFKAVHHLCDEKNIAD